MGKTNLHQAFVANGNDRVRLLLILNFFFNFHSYYKELQILRIIVGSYFLFCLVPIHVRKMYKYLYTISIRTILQRHVIC